MLCCWLTVFEDATEMISGEMLTLVSDVIKYDSISWWKLLGPVSKNATAPTHRGYLVCNSCLVTIILRVLPSRTRWSFCPKIRTQIVILFLLSSRIQSQHRYPFPCFLYVYCKPCNIGDYVWSWSTGWPSLVEIFTSICSQPTYKLYEDDLKYFQWPGSGGQTPMAIVIRPKAML